MNDHEEAPSWLDQEKLLKLRSQNEEASVVFALTPAESVVMNSILNRAKEWVHGEDVIDPEEHQMFHSISRKWEVVVHENDCCVDKECTYAK